MAENNNIEYITGESIERQLTAWGFPCRFSAVTTSPRLAKYYFYIDNLLQLSKIKKLAEPLTAWTRVKTKIITGENLGACDFCVEAELIHGYTLELSHLATETITAPPFSIPFGISTDGETIIKTLDELPHLLVAGTTGSGKSIALSSYIFALCSCNTSKNLKLILIDLKQVDFEPFKKVSHMIFDNIATTPGQAKFVLTWLVNEMEARYQKMKALKIEKNTGQFEKILLVIDELADLVLMDESIRPLLVKLLQKSRAAGIHVIVATQSPRAKILDGVTLANLPARLALTCASARESVLILGHKGAEDLTGRGDALLKLPDRTKPIHIQTPYISKEYIKSKII